MCLVTVLTGAGFKYTLERLSASKAIWIFVVPTDPDDEERFEDICDNFDSYDCKVEPRSFIEDLAKIRKEMYELMGIGRPGVPAST